MDESKMTRDDIIRMAREAGISESHASGMFEFLERFAELVRKDYSFTHAQLWLKRFDDAIKAEREAIHNALSQITKLPTLSHGVLVKLTDVESVI